MTHDEAWSAFPAVFVSYDAFQRLPLEEAIAFRHYLVYVHRLSAELQSSRPWDEYSNFSSWIDDLELDLSVRVNPFGQSSSRFSFWQIHSSWAADSTAPIAPAENDVLALVLREEKPTFGAEFGVAKRWLQRCGVGLATALASFSSSKSLAQAIGSLLVIECVFLRLLTFCYEARLTRQWEDS